MLLHLSCLQEFNVHMLHDSPLHVQQHHQLSAKASGEPPLMLAAAVACALQDALAAAWRDHEQQQQQQQQCREIASAAIASRQQRPVLRLPATTAYIKAALPPVLFSSPDSLSDYQPVV